jgi:hypothetical protein
MQLCTGVGTLGDACDDNNGWCGASCACARCVTACDSDAGLMCDLDTITCVPIVNHIYTAPPLPAQRQDFACVRARASRLLLT